MVGLCDREGLEALTDIFFPVQMTCVHGLCGESLSCELLCCEEVGQLQVLELPTSTRVMSQKTLHWHVRLDVITAPKRLNLKFVLPHAYTPSAECCSQVSWTTRPHSGNCEAAVKVSDTSDICKVFVSAKGMR